MSPKYIYIYIHVENVVAGTLMTPNEKCQKRVTIHQMKYLRVKTPHLIQDHRQGL